jgi:hypothetical protein
LIQVYALTSSQSPHETLDLFLARGAADAELREILDDEPAGWTLLRVVRIELDEQQLSNTKPFGQLVYRYFARMLRLPPGGAAARRAAKLEGLAHVQRGQSVRLVVPSIVCGPPPEREISIRRGFACSDSGISRLSTPWS